MRFLIGIITGTLLTLFIATAMDAPTRDTLTTAADAASGIWRALIERTSDALFPPAGTAAPADTVTDEEVAALLALAEASTPDSSNRIVEPAMSLAPPDELPPPPPVKAAVPAASVPVVSEDPDPAGSDDDAIVMTADDTPEAPFETAGVWTPFHSQRSAQGFAARLSRTLDHDFRVERVGTGAYQVVFDVGSPAERDALLTEIAEITGQ